MNFVLCSGSNPLCFEGTVPCMPSRLTQQYPKAIHRVPIHPDPQGRRQCGRKPSHPAPHAGAKGFGVSVVDQKRRREEKEEKETDQKHGNGEDDEDSIPEVVFERMLGRIVFFVASPMALGFGVLYLLSVMKEQGTWAAPVWLQLMTVLLAFGTSSLGLAYGTLSTNWDPDKKGSLLGWEEARKNWPELWKESSERKR